MYYLVCIILYVLSCIHHIALDSKRLEEIEGNETYRFFRFKAICKKKIDYGKNLDISNNVFKAYSARHPFS